MLNLPLAAPLGGGPCPWEVELAALLDAYAPGWDSGENTQNYAECVALALGLATMWAVNQRLRNQRVPLQMMETLGPWEDACQLRPLPGTSLQARRSALAARFLGFAGNTVAKLYKVCEALAGPLFLGFAAADPAKASVFIPGINPGPPGAENSSTRAHLAVRLTRSSLPDAEFLDLVRRIRLELNVLCPVWMTFSIGTDEGGAVAGVAIAGLTLI